MCTFILMTFPFYIQRVQKSYNEGVVLVRCPGCNNLHLIADHLGYFDDDSVNIEQILKAKGEDVSHAKVDENVFEMSEAELIALKAENDNNSNTNEK